MERTISIYPFSYMHCINHPSSSCSPHPSDTSADQPLPIPDHPDPSAPLIRRVCPSPRRTTTQQQRVPPFVCRSSPQPLPVARPPDTADTALAAHHPYRLRSVLWSGGRSLISVALGLRIATEGGDEALRAFVDNLLNWLHVRAWAMGSPNVRPDCDLRTARPRRLRR